MQIRVLIADDEAPARFGLAKALTSTHCTIIEAIDGPTALEAIRTQCPDLVFLDLNMPTLNGQGVLRELQKAECHCEIIVVTANDAIASAVECMKLGAADYITKPYEIEQLRGIVRRTKKRLELERRVGELQSRLDQQTAFGALIGVSRPMKELFQQMERAARAPIDILIRGETGTGKELIAREIHRLSERSAKPFVAVNTAAIPENLVESELFGHERGAFTGAENTRQGVFEQAHGGTLFLDEIGDMPMIAQAKILRALQQRTIQPVGSARSVAVDVRIISATHQDLSKAVADRHFRQDLYYRVKGIELTVAPLRQRREDILPLTDYFLDRVGTKRPEGTPRLAADAIQTMLVYSWPGNVRELEHVITAAAAMTTQSEITTADLRLADGGKDAVDFKPGSFVGMPMTEAKNRLIEAFERFTITAALKQHDGNVSAAARQLGIHRQNLQQKMTALRIVYSDNYFSRAH